MTIKPRTFYIILAALVILFTCLVMVVFGDQFNKAHVGREVTISWEKVNVREEHDTSSDIKAELTYGDKVTLTGYSFDYMGGDGNATDSWTKVQLADGTVGWIVTQSIKWH